MSNNKHSFNNVSAPITINMVPQSSTDDTQCKRKALKRLREIINSQNATKSVLQELRLLSSTETSSDELELFLNDVEAINDKIKQSILDQFSAHDAAKKQKKNRSRHHHVADIDDKVSNHMHGLHGVGDGVQAMKRTDERVNKAVDSKKAVSKPLKTVAHTDSSNQCVISKAVAVQPDEIHGNSRKRKIVMNNQKNENPPLKRAKSNPNENMSMNASFPSIHDNHDNPVFVPSKYGYLSPEPNNVPLALDSEIQHVMNKREWTTGDTTWWVTGLGVAYQQYAVVFENNSIDGAMMDIMTNEMLAPVIPHALHRAKILLTWNRM
eukprot:45516_1